MKLPVMERSAFLELGSDDWAYVRPINTAERNNILGVHFVICDATGRFIAPGDTLEGAMAEVRLHGLIPMYVH